jgi:ACS family hexuronate transporter-like MFS transporter
MLHGRVPRNAWKWWIAIVLFLATVLTYLDRQTLSLCAPMVCEEMHLSDEQYGQLLSAFRWTYAFTHVVAGFAADRLPLRATYALAVLLWSAAGAAAALVGRFSSLLLTRQVLGVGEAFNWPCATRIVANLLPPTDRAFASGIFNSGSAVGSLVAPFLILPLATWLGWRMAFFTIGALGLAWVVIWLWTTHGRTLAHEAPAVNRRTARSNLSAAVDWTRQVLLQPAFWMLFVVGVSVNPCWYFLNDWIPKYLHDQRGMSQITAGMISVPVFLAADVGNLAGGGLATYLATRGWSLRGARAATLTLAVLLILPVAWITQVPTALAAVALLACAAAGITAILANYTACQQDFSFAHVGAVAGILGMACNVFAAIVNPWIGRYVDRTGTYYLIFVLIGALPLVALAAILAFDTLIRRRAMAESESGTPA